jgi:hypothetical protein
MTALMKDNDRLYVLGDKIIHDKSGVFTFEMHYDLQGKYIGQLQTNMLDTFDTGGPDDLFFKAEIIDGLPCVNGKPIPDLTSEEISLARKNSAVCDTCAGVGCCEQDCDQRRFDRPEHYDPYDDVADSDEDETTAHG